MTASVIGNYVDTGWQSLSYVKLCTQSGRNRGKEHTSQPSFTAPAIRTSAGGAGRPSSCSGVLQQYTADLSSSCAQINIHSTRRFLLLQFYWQLPPFPSPLLSSPLLQHCISFPLQDYPQEVIRAMSGAYVLRNIYHRHQDSNIKFCFVWV
jgi:hypothetical protein